MRRRAATLALAACMAAAAPPPAAAAGVRASPQVRAAFTFGTPEPNGPTLLRDPAIGARVRLQPGEHLLRVTVTLDGHRHPVRVAPGGEAVYRPASPLPAGLYRASFTVVARMDGETWYGRVPFSFDILPEALSHLPGPTRVSLAALRALNRARLLAGVPAVRFAPRLQFTARAHADYLAANAALYAGGTSPHLEPDPSAPDFLAATPGERLGLVGVLAGGEVVDISCSDSASQDVSALLDTVFHRLLLLSPEISSAGAGLRPRGCARGLLGTPLVMDFDASGARVWKKPVLYPVPGETGVGTTFAARYEVPDPLPPAIAPSQGYPVTVLFSGKGTARLGSAVLRAAGSKRPLPVYALDSSWVNPGPPDPAASMGNAVAIVPRSPLRPGTWYVVALQGVETPAGHPGRPFHLKWRFRTAPAG